MGADRNIDLYSQGACVYRLDEGGNDIEIVAWARNHGAAVAAWREMRRNDPAGRYQARHRGWILRNPDDK
jgi:hypothetical protein